MFIPQHLEPTVRELIRRHWADQQAQVRLMGHDHPEGRRAARHLTEARELAEIAGVDGAVAA